MNKSAKGYVIIEVIVVLGIVSLFIVVIGKTLLSVNKLNAMGAKQTKALHYAQESLEIINILKNQVFACTCSYDNCISNTCTSISDGQSCDLFTAYTSCWTEYPRGSIGQSDYYLEKSGSTWQLKPLTSPTEIIAGDPDFERKITIENAMRDSDGNITTPGTTDYNTKKITVTVWYKEKESTHKVNLKTILTAWENL